MRPSLNPLPRFPRHPLPRALAGAVSCLGLCCALGCADGAPAPQAETAVEIAVPTGQTLSAYYTWYQDPNCQSGQPQTSALSCPEIGTPCPTTLLEASPVTASAAEFVDLFFVAPSQTAGLRLETLVDGLANQASGSCSPGYCDPPAALAQGIAAAHAAGKKVVLAVLPGSGDATWGPPFDLDAFKATSQQVLQGWDIDGFDMDCEPCAGDVDTIFDAWAGLTANPGRGLPTAGGGQRPYVFLTAETYTLPQLQASTTLDYLQIMDGNYSADADEMLLNLQSVRQAWAGTQPDVPILLGVKPGVTSLSVLNQALGDSTTAAWQAEAPFGWMLFNVSRDAGCLTGAGTSTCNPPTQEIIDSYPALATCTAYGQYGLASPPTASYSLLDCLTGFLETGGLSQCGSEGASP